MLIAMNRFRVLPGQEEEFERRWSERESFIADAPGFEMFLLLRSDEPGEYISHSTWESREAFEAWMQSDIFRRAHGRPLTGSVLAEAPHVSLYEALLATPGRASES